MLSKENISKHLPVEMADGAQIHVDHSDCEAGVDTRQRLYIKRKGRSYLAYCHNCGQGGLLVMSRVISGDRGVPLTASVSEESTYAAPRAVDLTREYNDWPEHSQAWVCKYFEIPRAVCSGWGIEYHNPTGRLYLPVYDFRNPGGMGPYPVRYLLRKTHDKDASTKVLSYRDKKFPHTSGKWQPATVPSSAKAIVVCEDLVSAICLQIVGYSTYCLFGTHWNNEDVLEIIQCNENKLPIVVWGDNDVPGRHMTRGLTEALRLFTSNVHPVSMLAAPEHVSPKDFSIKKAGPGFVSLEQIVKEAITRA